MLELKGVNAGYGSFQAPLRHLFLASLGLAVVSGIAIAELSTRRDRIRIMAAAGMGIALAMIHVRSALDAWWSLAGIFSGGMLGLFILGQAGTRTSGRAALAAVLVGVVVIVWMTFSPRRRRSWRTGTTSACISTAPASSGAAIPCATASARPEHPMCGCC